MYSAAPSVLSCTDENDHGLRENDRGVHETIEGTSDDTTIFTRRYFNFSKSPATHSSPATHTHRHTQAHTRDFVQFSPTFCKIFMGLSNILTEVCEVVTEMFAWSCVTFYGAL